MQRRTDNASSADGQCIICRQVIYHLSGGNPLAVNNEAFFCLIMNTLRRNRLPPPQEKSSDTIVENVRFAPVFHNYGEEVLAFLIFFAEYCPENLRK